MYGKKEYAHINALLNQKIEEKKHLIAVHRGTWHGNIIQNTIPAYQISLKMGADMVEADIVSSKDGVLFSFHDHHEPDVLRRPELIMELTSEEIEAIHPSNCITLYSRYKINRLTEILDFLPEGVLLNIDRAWDILPQVLKVLDQYPKALSQVVIKAPLRAEKAFEAMENHPVKYMFMPICYSIEDVDKALAYGKINTVGIETIAFTPEHELFSDEALAYIHGKGLYCWVNAITLGNFNKHDDSPRNDLYGGLDDDISILDDPAKGWGKLMDKGIEIIQTDWPALLYDYRAKRG